MTDKPFLPTYAGQTIDRLLELEEDYRIDSLVLALEQALWEKRERIGKYALSDEALTVLAVEALEREVNNGGYHQFFLNGSNEFTARIVEDLKRIDCEETAKITEQAIAALELPNFEPATINEYAIESDDKLDEALNDFDNLYYALAEDIAGKLFAFVKRNKDAFSIP